MSILEKIELGYFAKVVLGRLTDSSVLSNILHVVKDTTTTGKPGGTVDLETVVLEGITARKRTKADKDAMRDYEIDTIKFTVLGVKLDDETYTSLSIDTWDTMDITDANISDFANTIEQLVNALRQDLERATGELFAGISGVNVEAVTVTADDKAGRGEEIIEALQAKSFDFNDLGVSAEGRYAVVGRNVALELLASKAILSAAESGDNTSAALRKAIIGEVAGFTVIQSSAVDPDSAVVMQKEGLALVSRAPGPNHSAIYSELFSESVAPIDIRVNVVSTAMKNGTAIIAGTFFAVTETVEAGENNPRVKKLVFSRDAG